MVKFTYKELIALPPDKVEILRACEMTVRMEGRDPHVMAPGNVVLMLKAIRDFKGTFADLNPTQRHWWASMNVAFNFQPSDS